jgi:hypothetical protein
MDLNTTDPGADILLGERVAESRRALSKTVKRAPYRRTGPRRLSVVSAKIDSDLLAAVNAAAERRGVTRSSFIEGVLGARVKELRREAAE